MRNKIIMLLFGLLFFLVMYNTIYMMYVLVESNDLGIGDDNTNVEYASQLYVLMTIIMSILMLFLKNITARLKQIFIAMVTFFYVESLILTLITFYSNPNNRVEVMAGAMFFIGGSLVLATLFFVHTLKENREKKELGLFHKIIRYVLVLIVGAMILKSVVGMVDLVGVLS